MIIRKLRLKRGWSQEQLSELSGLSVRTVQPHSGNLGGLPPRWIAYNGMNHCRVSHLWSYRETAITSID